MATISEEVRTMSEADIETELSLSDIYMLLSNERRLIVIELLARDRSEWDKRDLARELVTRTKGEGHSYSDYQNAHVSLIQTHLPKLRDHGVIRAGGDGERRLDPISPGPAFDLVLNAKNGAALAMSAERALGEGKTGESA
ncbi:hypothetical protein C497_03585 [Halalkalicoccus jeotgali B3]|uniref:DUF7344 domain-containing protein n=2 Tax=Halalkalicoccus jeotgali TaxID=413810 RepID=D8J9L9_HALJB|nr:hypothetical protein HacjB3_05200 [Halalkalicoccus jeotgali B3]ELY40147.1 hypothetical protein C497_03585 [Halalkalicoccus jeotgali B3]